MSDRNSNSADDTRIAEILNQIMHFAAGDLRSRSSLKNDGSVLDGVIVGINILGEELEARITQLQQTQQETAESELLFHSIFDFVQDGIIVADATTKRFLQVNAAICRMLGYTREELQKLDILAIHPPQDISSIERIFERIVQNELSVLTLRMMRKDGSVFQAEINTSKMSIKGVPCMIGVFRDLSGQLRLEQAEELARHDGLTGLFNHETFKVLLANELERMQRSGTSVSLLMIDIDHFKNVNDTQGHLAGDAILHQIGQLLQNSARTIDSVCRYGGEEITLILPMTNSDEAMQMAERLRIMVEKQAFDCSNGNSLHITVSIGVASYPLHAQTLTALIDVADAAMYAAKHAGRNRSCFPYSAC